MNPVENSYDLKMTKYFRGETSHLYRLAEVFTSREGSFNLNIISEVQQVTGSFKVRGALAAVFKLGHKTGAEIHVASSGNFGLGIAYACNHFGLRAVIHVSSNLADMKLQALTALNAEIISHYESYDDAKIGAMKSATNSEFGYFLDGATQETFYGNGSILLEFSEREPSHEDIDLIIVPLGIGSLYCPTQLLQRVLFPNAKIVIVEPENFTKYLLNTSVQNFNETKHSIADGAAVHRLPEITRYLLGRYQPIGISVSEDQITNALRYLHKERDISAEGAGALGIAGLLASQELRSNFKNISCVVTGSNFNRVEMSKILKN